MQLVKESYEETLKTQLVHLGERIDNLETKAARAGSITVDRMKRITTLRARREDLLRRLHALNADDENRAWEALKNDIQETLNELQDTTHPS